MALDGVEGEIGEGGAVVGVWGVVVGVEVSIGVLVAVGIGGVVAVGVIVMGAVVGIVVVVAVVGIVVVVAVGIVVVAGRKSCSASMWENNSRPRDTCS